MGKSLKPTKDEIYPQTRYILCHLLSEIFIRLGTLIEDDLAKLLALEEGYKRLVGVEILFLMKRKNCEVKQYLNTVITIHSKEWIHGPLIKARWSSNFPH